jgi:2-phospho-L-lactate transferase/gluconeogenesis factor (CofD/UPF0052 family)
MAAIEEAVVRIPCLEKAMSIASATMLPASLEHALHRCILLASRFGAIRLAKPEDRDRREFVLDLDGTELTIARAPGITRLTNFARRGSAADRQLQRRIQLLPHIACLKIAVIGGGTGLSTTLLGLRDRTWSPTAVISGLPRPVRALDPKDQLGSLPRDDASMCLVGLTPTVEENVVLRGLLSHQLESHDRRGAHFGTVLLSALEEIHGSRQGALDAAVELLGIRGRIVLAVDAAGRAPLTSLSEADMIVIAPGHLELDLIPVLSCPGVIDAIRGSEALKVVVTKIMTAEDTSEVATTSNHVGALSSLTGIVFDVALANSGPFNPAQLRAYGKAGARPVRPDTEMTMPYTRRLLTEQLAAAGDLARHDPQALGECLVEIGAEHLLNSMDAEAQRA